jgi:hypothetical protein
MVCKGDHYSHLCPCMDEAYSLLEKLRLLKGCNVPTLGHHQRAETYDDQSSQMDVIASTGVFERHSGV